MGVLLADLVTGARTAASMQSGGPWASSEWDAAVNNAVRAFYVDATAVNQRWKVTRATLTIASSSSPSASLPADFMNALEVWEYQGTQSRRRLRMSGDESAMQWERTYRLEGALLFIDPLEQSVGSYELAYNPLPTLLTSLVDLDGELVQHREYFELHAAIAALTSEQSSTADIAPRFQICDLRAKEWAARLRSSDPSRPRDVRPRGGRLRMGWP